VVIWDSNGSSDDGDSSDGDKKSLKKALASTTINNMPSIFDTPSTCLMANPIKVKYDMSDDNECESDDYRSDEEEEEEYSKESWTCVSKYTLRGRVNHYCTWAYWAAYATPRDLTFTIQALFSSSQKTLHSITSNVWTHVWSSKCRLKITNCTDCVYFAR
jgi:hypothetical protein